MWTSSKHDTLTASALIAACTEIRTMYEEENMDNTVTRIERRSDGSYIVTVNGKNFECENTQAMLNFLGEVGDAKNEMR